MEFFYSFITSKSIIISTKTHLQRCKQSFSRQKGSLGAPFILPLKMDSRFYVVLIDAKRSPVSVTGILCIKLLYISQILLLLETNNIFLIHILYTQTFEIVFIHDYSPSNKTQHFFPSHGVKRGRGYTKIRKRSLPDLVPQHCFHMIATVELCCSFINLIILYTLRHALVWIKWCKVWSGNYTD